MVLALRRRYIVKRSICTYLAALPILLVLVLNGIYGWPSVSATGAIEAASGDPMRVIINHVKADKRAQFEKYIYEVLLPAVEKNAESDPISKNILEQTRMLEPSQANEDGSYTYIWLMDPYVEDADYSYKGILTRVHGPEETEKYLSMARECLAVPQVFYRVKQGRW
jgi:hypothetical protein